MAFLCFKDAWARKESHAITEQEYIFHLVAHFGGIRHLGDTPVADDILLDPFGASVRDVALRDNYKPLDRTNLCEKIFSDCLAGNLEGVLAGLDELRTTQSPPDLIQPLAVLAASKGHSHILQYFLDHGATIDDHLNAAILSGARTSAMLEVLWAANWRGIRDSPQVLDALVLDGVRDAPETVTWLLDHGARVNDDTVRRVMRLGSPISVPVLNMLINRTGLSPFRRSSALQFAAQRGDVSVVQCLLDAGIEADNMPAPVDARGLMGTALYEAVLKDQVEVARLLLEREAHVHAAGPGGYPDRTPLFEAEQHGNPEMVGLLEQWAEPRVKAEE